MPSRVLVIGLDAAEATLIERWAGEGLLPQFADLGRRGTAYRMANSMETLPGAIWPEITHGRSCGQLPLYYHPLQLHTGESRPRPVLAEEIPAEQYYWAVAARAGHRIAAIDQTQTVLVPGLNGVQLAEWGMHDRNFRVAGQPPEFFRHVIEEYGEHPLTRCDLHGRTVAGYRRLLEVLLDGAERKTRLVLDLLRRENWDLMTIAFGETHCAGHQFWHFLDPLHPSYDPGAPQDLQQAMRTVYQALDEKLARIIDAAGPAADVLVFTSHGMRLATAGPQLLPEFLVRMGMGSDDGRAVGANWIRRLQTKVSHLPRPVQPLLRRLAQWGPVKRVESAAGCLLDPLESPRTRAVALRNNRCGAIRINLEGREPHGRIRPGDELRDLVDGLRRELLALRHPESREPIVKRVVTAVEAFGADHHPDVPDLIVVFRDDLGVLESCVSDRVGTIQVRKFHPNIPRSGDHSVESRLWLLGPGLAPGTGIEQANVLDIAPTVLRLLDVPLPAHLDGGPLPLIERRGKRSSP